MDNKIRIMEIERFATHDGDGIRSTVFMKGCPLHCPWCANPESQEYKIQILYDKSKCKFCKKCVDLSNGVISFEGDKITIDQNRAEECKEAVYECMDDAIYFDSEDVELKEILHTLSKDNQYYINSNGGITISGGEPFYKFDDFKLLLENISGKYNIAVETTGYTSLENIKEVNKYIDTYLYDIKHLDVKKFNEVVGGDLNIILENFQYLADNYPEKMVVRVPVIYDFNEDVIEDIIEYVSKTKINEIHLLPFHNFGKKKYEKLQLDYKYRDYKSMPLQLLNKYIEIGKKYNIKVVVGG
jgi:pyruvate formate lyase activating enzyme